MPLTFTTNRNAPISFRDFKPADWFSDHLSIPGTESSPLNLYVATTGSDTTGDGSAANPWRTCDFACTFIRENYSTNVSQTNHPQIIIVNIAAGTYTDKVHCDFLFNVLFQGAGQSLTIFDGAHTGIFGTFGPCFVVLSELKIQNTGSPGVGVGLAGGWAGAVWQLADVTFGSGLVRQISAESLSRIYSSSGTVTFAGGAQYGMFAGSYGLIDIDGASIAMTGTPNYTGAFAWAAGGTIFVESATTITGSATGKRFIVENGGLIATGDGTLTDTAGLTFFPGDAAGTGFSNGAYDNYIFDTDLAAVPNTQTGATYTIVETDRTIIANHAGTVTLTFPAASSWNGRRLLVKTIQAQTVVSASSNVVPLVGGAAGTAILAATAGKWAELVSDGTNWVIMAGA